VDRDLIYYPVHLTPGYEAAAKASEYQSDVSGSWKVMADVSFLLKDNLRMA